MIHKITTHPKFNQVIEWGKLISVTGLAQVIVQGVSLICGILIIRFLPTQEYAYYTIANAMLGTMSLLADGGISTGVMSEGGKVWNDKAALGSVLSTGLDLRKKFAVFSLLVSIPILTYLLWHQGASALVILLIIVTLIPSFFAALSDSLLEIVPKLHQDIKPLQANQVMVGVFRLILSSLSVFFLPFTFVALLANGLPRIYGNIHLKRIAFKFADKRQKPDAIKRQEILKSVKLILPGAIYYCLSGQITIWLISAFGTTSSIAQVGALGRLSMALGLFGTLFSTLIIPRFARFKADKSLLLTRFIKIVAGLLLLSLFIVLFAYIFPVQLLWILGKEYSNLSDALVLSIAGGCMNLIAGSVFGLCASRGWIINPAISIPINVLGILLGVLVLDVSSIQGVLILNILVALVQAMMWFIFFIIRIIKLK